MFRIFLLTIFISSFSNGFLTRSRKNNCRLLNFSPASIFKVFQSHPKLVKMLSECQTAWILVRCQIICFGYKKKQGLNVWG